MKRIRVIHNKGAGDGQYNKKALTRLIADGGFSCEYSSTKKNDWKKLTPHIDLLATAGGDGTVRSVVKHLLSRRLLQKQYPIGVLPMGTANNIAKTLDLGDSHEEIVAQWKAGNIRPFDVGSIEGTGNAAFFLESFGYGIFPYLMLEMEKTTVPSSATAEDSLRIALETLHRIIGRYEPRFCSLIIDGVDYSGEYILAEIMNIRSIGPNLLLCPDSSPGDGVFEVVLIGADDKDKFASYIREKILGNDPVYDFRPIGGKRIGIAWNGKHVHMDDEIIRMRKNKPLTVEVRPGLVKFMAGG